MNSSEAVQALIKESYKQTRRDDDRNQPRSVQPWFSDQHRRKYWLIEGQDDSHFRIYRENDGKTAKTNTWFSVAESISEVLALADKFAEEHTSNSKVISDRLRAAIPRFEAGEEVGYMYEALGDGLTLVQKRRRRDYRLARKAAFTRPEPGFSMYEGRTRGKRMRYTYSDDEYGSDGVSSKRSARGSGVSTPMETGPTVTASGRQVKSRVGGMYGESILVDQRKELERVAGEGHFTETSEDMPTTVPNGKAPRTSRSGREVKPPRPRYGDDGDSDQSDEAQSSGKEWSGDENEPDVSEPDFDGEEEDEDMENDEVGEVEEDENTQESLVVQLRYRKGGQKPPSSTAHVQPIQPQPQPQQQRQQPLHGHDFAVVINTVKPTMPALETSAAEHVTGDTIDVGPPLKLVNGTNGAGLSHHLLPLAPRPVVEIAEQRMEFS